MNTAVKDVTMKVLGQFEFSLVTYKALVIHDKDSRYPFRCSLVFKPTGNAVFTTENYNVDALCYALHKQILVHEDNKVEPSLLLLYIEDIRTRLNMHLDKLRFTSNP